MPHILPNCRVSFPADPPTPGVTRLSFDWTTPDKRKWHIGLAFDGEVTPLMREVFSAYIEKAGDSVARSILAPETIH